jgi:predicted polyphosphate/ATP-dependent NAD kinase
MKIRVGLVVNPVAGLGGPAGLKGSDGLDVQARAYELGSLAHSGERCVRFLNSVSDLAGQCQLITGAGDLGESWAREAGWEPEVVFSPERWPTCGDDTRELARACLAEDVAVLAFVGGDGTARDVAEAVGVTVLCLGVPSGVKMQSGVFGLTPEAAGGLLRAVVSGTATVEEAEVIDIDEEALRRGRLTSRLYSVVQVPQQAHLRQSRKMGSPYMASGSLDGIAADCAERIAHADVVLLGPGSTIAEIAHFFGVESTLVGVDVMVDRQVVASDVNAQQVNAFTRNREVLVIVTPIGGQGVILGRGNQQIDARLLSWLPQERLLVASTPEKLARLPEGRLYVDLASPELNNRWAVPRRVITGFQQEAVVPVAVL